MLRLAWEPQPRGPHARRRVPCSASSPRRVDALEHVFSRSCAAKQGRLGLVHEAVRSLEGLENHRPVASLVHHLLARRQVLQAGDQAGVLGLLEHLRVQGRAHRLRRGLALGGPPSLLGGLLGRGRGSVRLPLGGALRRALLLGRRLLLRLAGLVLHHGRFVLLLGRLVLLLVGCLVRLGDRLPGLGRQLRRAAEGVVAGSLRLRRELGALLVHEDAVGAAGGPLGGVLVLLRLLALLLLPLRLDVVVGGLVLVVLGLRLLVPGLVGRLVGIAHGLPGRGGDLRGPSEASVSGGHGLLLELLALLVEPREVGGGGPLRAIGLDVSASHIVKEWSGRLVGMRA
mmetsp:Transcript_16791/g.50422  ORF Transcript_16791/g.50422 Transcript_16791/m.50422 type:complete len:342 (-) Transcript_16791:24-1049(-)